MSLRAFIAPSVTGAIVDMRPVQPDDAAYIHGLRIDPAYNQHLSQVTGTVGDRRAQ